jgi:hypothetical protein
MICTGKVRNKIDYRFGFEWENVFNVILGTASGVTKFFQAGSWANACTLTQFDIYI